MLDLVNKSDHQNLHRFAYEIERIDASFDDESDAPPWYKGGTFY
jgi:hypothetical protein